MISVFLFIDRLRWIAVLIILKYRLTYRINHTFSTNPKTGVLHSIDPELVNQDQVQKSTNIENLNMAFDLAEENFGIPRFLDAVDIDVDKLGMNI